MKSDTTTTGELSGAALSEPSTAPAIFVVLAGGRVGQRFPLQSPATIGRGGEATVPLEHQSISRRHAVVLTRDDGSHEIQDLESVNGTLVNGVRVVTSAPLRFGDRVQVGSVVMLFTHADPLEDQIRQRQKLEAIGRLGAGMAHDVNNLLAGVLTNAEFLRGLGPEPRLGDPHVSTALEDLRAAALEAAEFTRRILSFARLGGGGYTQIDLVGLVNDGVEMARRSMDRTVTFERKVEPPVHVRGDRVLLQQVLMNLFLNARDAMPAGGTIVVECRRALPSDVQVERVALAAAYALVRISDSGVGMSAAVSARAFEPFFTTKAATGGSGLGLAMVKEVVLAHGGSVDVRSARDHGAEFSIVLPALLSAGRAERPTPFAPSLRTAAPIAGSILLVDDEPLSRRGVARLLERDGHRVAGVGDGAEALDCIRADPSRFEVALLDLDLPRIDGQELQLQLRAVAPELRVVFLTGFVADERRAALLDAGAVAVLMKPCETAVLRETVATALRLRTRR